MKNTTVQIYNYNDTPVSFRMEDGMIMINATAMAKPFGKRPVDYLRLPSTTELVQAIVRKSHICESQLIRAVKGSPEYGGGTWFHEDVALDFAQWLSVDFRLWVNERIKEMLHYGITAQFVNDPHIMLNFIDKMRDGIARSLTLEEENKRLTQTIQEQAHKVEFYDQLQVVKSENEAKAVFRISDIARELDMKAGELNIFLQKRGIQKKCGRLWLPARGYDGKGYTRRGKYQTGYDEDGEPIYQPYTLWTVKGREFILSLFENS